MKGDLSKQTEVEEKVKRLQEEYGIEMNHNLEKEMSTMCNLAEGLIEEAKVEAKYEGIDEGIVKGTNRILTLIRCLSENGELDKIAQLPEDKHLLEELCEKYHIS